MYRIKKLCIGLCMFSLSCKNNPSITINSENEILDSKARAEKNTTHFEGRFVSLTKLNPREYTLVLLDPANKLDSFRTLMPLDSFEISSLAKKGNNIILQYFKFNNPVTKNTDKVVRSMVPVYEFQKSRSSNKPLHSP